MRMMAYNKQENIFYSDFDRDFLRQRLADKDLLFWVDIFTPTPEHMTILKDVFNFHSLAIEDATSKIERPKIDEYDTYIYMVLQVPLKVNQTKKLENGVVSIFLGKNFIVTVHEINFTPIKKIFNSFVENKKISSKDSGDLLHKLIDTLMDYCLPIADEIYKSISVLEDKVLDSLDKNSIADILILKRNTLLCKNILKPEIVLLRKLEQTDLKYISDEMEVYFGDIVDHAEKVSDILGTCLELIESLYQSYQSLMSNKINDVMRILTTISVIIMPLTLISGIYGMNINLPFQTSEYAFIIVIEAMLFISLVMLIFFRKKDWI